MRIIKATLEHLDLLTPLFVRYREFYGQLPYPDSSRSFLEKRLKHDGANPFETFEAIPAVARYQFMLDNAEYFVRTSSVARCAAGRSPPT